MRSDELIASHQETAKRIFQACQTSQRNPETITLIWVSKTRPWEDILAAVQAGALHFGENRIQEAVDKFTAKPEGTFLHIIGPVQSNKLRKAAQLADYIHSISDITALNRLNSLALEFNRKIKVLFQINVSGEESKSGLDYDSAESFLNNLPQTTNLLYCGLMTIGVHTGVPEDSRVHFRRLCELRNQFYKKDERFMAFEHLSMGMTDDLEIAVEEGATLVRIGSALFGNRSSQP
jgi:pyridoxal phosphate enzyme (YggS family)